MIFSDEFKFLIKVYLVQDYGLMKLMTEFHEKNWKRRGLDKLRETGLTDWWVVEVHTTSNLYPDQRREHFEHALWKYKRLVDPATVTCVSDLKWQDSYRIFWVICDKFAFCIWQFQKVVFKVWYYSMNCVGNLILFSVVKGFLKIS